MLTSIYISGYKSFRDEVEVEIKPLTILSGSNSSGKSSLIQPLLLFKQTLHTSSDPGPLKLDGPNVIFSRSEQLFWKAPGYQSDSLEIGFSIRTNDRPITVKVSFRRKTEARGVPSLEVERTLWILDKKVIELSPKIKKKILTQILVSYFVNLSSLFGALGQALLVSIKRQRCFLIGTVGIGGAEFAQFPTEISMVEQFLRKLIHVPGLRGNPERAYPVREVGKEFPGLFQDYVASLIARWQRRKSQQWKMLNDSLRRMNLTWKVRAYQRSDTEVEIQVGRTVRSRRGGAKDLVNIADVGFGLTQSLPVLVALIAADPGQTVYVEQPEIHLHPEAQVAMAEIISEAVKRGVQVIVETHSHLLLMAFQRSIATGLLPPESAILHWFQRDQDGVTKVSSTTFTEEGSFVNADIPVDFADVSMKLIREYLEAVD